MSDPIRVVLADDDPAFLEALAVALELDGRFEVVGMAGDGGEAFQLGCWQEPDVVVMDAEMPRIDGWEAARLLSQSRPRTCVLTTTHEMTDVTSMIAVAVATASTMLFSVARAIDGNAMTKRYGSSVSVRSAASEGTA